MPHIIIQAFYQGLNVEKMDIHVYAKFSDAYFADGNKAERKLDEIKKDLEEVVKKYFDDNYTDQSFISNHHYNVFNKH